MDFGGDSEDEMTTESVLGEQEYSDIDDFDGSEEIEFEESSDSEVENEDLPAATVNGRNDEFIAKDETVWNKNPPAICRIRKHNILREKGGTHQSTKSLTIVEMFKLFFTAEMAEIIIRETNRKAATVFETYSQKFPEKPRKIWKAITSEELDAFLGVVIAAGVHHSNNEHVSEMWKSEALPIYRAALSKDRFQTILRFIRFDDCQTREERRTHDKAAPIRVIWEKLNENLRKYYTPGDSLTIDEQLYPYRGRTKFTQYMPNKPAKYGIKIWWICDSKSSFPLHGQIYTGKSADSSREVGVGERVVRDLCSVYKGSGRNMVMDNYFTTLPLADSLMKWNLSLTLKKNKAYIPKEMLPSKDRPPMSTLFGFHDNVTMCSYVPKKNKSVVLLSTMHYDTAVSGDKQKPEIIHHYNATKGGVDSMDKMLSHFTTKRKTCRWPLALFFNVIDICGLASYIIYKANKPSKKTYYRRKVLNELSKALPSVLNRAKNPRVTGQVSTRTAIELVTGKSIKENLPLPQNNPRKRQADGRLTICGSCYVCKNETTKKRRKTRKWCSKCNNPVCNEHTAQVTTCIFCQ